MIEYLESQGLKVTGKTERTARGLLDKNCLLFSDEIEGYTPRRTYFAGARFIVSPTEEEVDSSILIPGHRFLPFHSPNVMPWQCQFITADGMQVSRKKISVKTRDVLIYFSLFGLENLPSILMADDRGNEEAAFTGNLDSEVTISAFDMKQVFEAFGFQQEDGLILTVTDWKKGTFSVEHVSQDQRNADPDWQEQWIGTLEEGFDIAFGALGIHADMEEQIAYAFYFGGKELIERPAIHLGGFIDRTDFVEFQKLGTKTCLWQIDEDVAEALVDSYEAHESGGVDYSLEAILDDIGLSLSSGEIEAYLRDELYHGGNSLESALERCLRGKKIVFYDNDQQAAFHRFISRLWKKVKKAYNLKSDQQAGKLREKALGILDIQLEWMRDLDAQGILPGELPTDKMIAVAQMTGQISSVIEALNEQRPIGSEATSQLMGNLDTLEERLRQKLDEIENVRRWGSHPNLRLA